MKKFVCLFVCLLAGSANATVIDFTVFASGDTGSTTLVTPEATFNSFGGNFFIGAAGIDSELCALSGFNCAADFEAIFVSEIENLTLVTSGAQTGDFVEIFAYDISNNLLGSATQTINGLVDLTAFSGISRLFFDDSSTAAGFGYDAITFDFVASVPEPTALALIGLGLAGIGFSRKKRSA